MRRSEALKGEWKRHLDSLMNEGEAVVTCIGIKKGGRRLFMYEGNQKRGG